MVFGIVSFVVLFGLSIAADLSVPDTWREFSNSRPLDERISISQDAINSMMTQYDSSTEQFNGIGFWQAGNVWSALANQDHIAQTTTNQATTVAALKNAWSLYSQYDPNQYNDDAQWWATAAYYAYRAYGDTDLLNDAISVWNHVSEFVISASDASSGSISTKNFAIEGTCDGATMAGGVFWRPTVDDDNINSITTGLYVTLSAFLAEATGDSKYTDAAILSANWIKAHNLNSDNIVLDTEHAKDCSKSPDTWLFTYNSGKFLEGLSVLANVTGDSQWSDLAVNILASSVKSSAWEGSDGIITEGASPSENNDGVGFKAIFIRGLHEVFDRSTNNDLRILVHSYVDVQYNALLELAANGTTYSSAWEGPAQAFTSWGQLASLDVFVSAIDAN